MSSKCLGIADRNRVLAILQLRFILSQVERHAYRSLTTTYPCRSGFTSLCADCNTIAVTSTRVKHILSYTYVSTYMSCFVTKSSHSHDWSEGSHRRFRPCVL